MKLTKRHDRCFEAWFAPDGQLAAEIGYAKCLGGDQHVLKFFRPGNRSSQPDVVGYERGVSYARFRIAELVRRHWRNQ